MKKLAYSILVVAAIIVITAQRTPSSAADTVAPPVAKKLHTENHINGGTLADDYHWLREKSNPEVARYLEAENSYTDSVMRRRKPCKKGSMTRCSATSRRPMSMCLTKKATTSIIRAGKQESST